jgi:hypothetical protein
MKTLKGKIDNAIWVSSNNEVVSKLEQIAEEFAIDFAEWCDRSKTFWTPTKELLEIYKKEKGL